MSDKPKSIILIQGFFQDAFFDVLKKQKAKEVFVLEGRPSLDAAQNSCKALLKRKITPTLMTDSMAGFLFYKGLVKQVCMAHQLSDQDGALCEIGALILAVLCRKHRIPCHLYPSGRKTKLMGTQKSLTHFQNIRIAPRRVKGYVPLAEWVPKKYIDRIFS